MCWARSFLARNQDAAVASIGVLAAAVTEPSAAPTHANLFLRRRQWNCGYRTIDEGGSGLVGGRVVAHERILVYLFEGQSVADQVENFGGRDVVDVRVARVEIVN